MIWRGVLIGVLVIAAMCANAGIWLLLDLAVNPTPLLQALHGWWAYYAAWAGDLLRLGLVVLAALCALASRRAAVTLGRFALVAQLAAIVSTIIVLALVIEMESRGVLVDSWPFQRLLIVLAGSQVAVLVLLLAGVSLASAWLMDQKYAEAKWREDSIFKNSRFSDPHQRRT